MKKNLTTINQFIDKSIGEWKSIRSTHTLAFQEFENSISKIYIKNINSKNKKVVEIFKNYKLSFNLENTAISIKWQSTSDWEEDDMSEGGETIFIFLPNDENSGIRSGIKRKTAEKPNFDRKTLTLKRAKFFIPKEKSICPSVLKIFF